MSVTLLIDGAVRKRLHSHPCCTATYRQGRIKVFGALWLCTITGLY